MSKIWLTFSSFLNIFASQFLNIYELLVVVYSYNKMVIQHVYRISFRFVYFSHEKIFILNIRLEWPIFRIYIFSCHGFDGWSDGFIKKKKGA